MKPTFLAALLFAAGAPAVLFAYNAPIGIPNPATTFGWEIDRATPAWPSQWTATTPTDAPNCYYVDKTAGTATDTSNPNGNPAKPRKSIPEGVLAAGAFIYVNAGTYTATDSAGDRYDWCGAGTSANPIWITGNSTTHPVIQEHCQIGGTIGVGNNASFIVFENFDLLDASTSTSRTNATLDICPVTDGNTIDHVLVRNVKRVGLQRADDQNGVTIGNSSNSDPIPNSTLTNIVIYNCDISYCGDPSPTGSDDCGVYNAYHTDSVWVLDNTVHDVGADGIAGSHYSNYTDRRTEHYYIGRNTTYHNGENGIDLKGDRYVIISQNSITGPFTREQGWGIVLHYGFSTSYWDRDVHVILNKINHVSGGIYTGTSSGCDNLNVIGNVLTDVHASYAVTADPLNGFCVQVGGSHGTIRIANNTCYDYDGGIRIQSLVSGDAVKVHGNIFASRASLTGYELYAVAGQESFVQSDYNLFTGTPSFFWNNTLRTLSYVRSNASLEPHSVLSDPAFANAAGGDFHLTDTSPAIDVSPEGPVGDTAYAAFQTLFGADIRKDFDGRTRPVDGMWDIGAFESALPPRAPSNLQVAP